MIATIEEISLNALPAIQTFLYDGWIVRMGKGYSRRANSVQTYGVSQTFGASKLPLDEKIAYCEMLYRQHELPATFKMTAVSQPENLDAILEQHGYHIEGHTCVQTCALENFQTMQNEKVSIAETWNDFWYDEFCRLNHLAEVSRAPLKQMLQLILPRTAFALLQNEHGICACGLGVLQGSYLGLFDIVTDANFRHRGYGQQLVSQLLTWGKTCGASLAYLQVVANNEPALNLYKQLGFAKQYEYWYRVRN